MAITRKAVRLWHQKRLAELEHQHDLAYLFAVDADDEEAMRAELFREWRELFTAPRMEIPPEHFQNQVADLKTRG